MNVTVTVGAQDYSVVTLDGVSITWGRQDLSAPPAPSTCTVTLLRDDQLTAPIEPDLFTIGSELTVTVTPQRSAVHGVILEDWITDTYLDPDTQPAMTRFSGRVTDVTVTRDTVELVAVSRLLSSLARLDTEFPAAPGPVELVAAVGDALTHVAGELAPVTVTLGPPTVFTVDPDASGPVNAATYVQDLAGVIPGGAVWESPDGLELRYTVGNRATNDPLVSIRADEVGEEWTLTKTVGDRRNVVTVEWLSGTVVAEDATDIAVHGRYPLELAAPLDNATDATTVGRLQLVAGTNPSWRLDSLNVPLAALAPWRQAQLVAGLVPDVMLEVPELVDGVQVFYFLEGWDEILGPQRWDLTLYLSDANLTRPPQPWDDAAAYGTWDEMVPSGLTWDDLLTTWITPVI